MFDHREFTMKYAGKLLPFSEGSLFGELKNMPQDTNPASIKIAGEVSTRE